jgi:hypothetical protein
VKDINAELKKLERSNTLDVPNKAHGPTLFDRKEQLSRGQTLQPFSKDGLKKRFKGMMPFLEQYMGSWKGS